MFSTQSDGERGISERGTGDTPEQKILELLRLRFTDPNDPELYVRRQQLKKTFQLLEPSRAAILHTRLKKLDPKNKMSQLFYKLATATRKELLGILKEKITMQRQTPHSSSRQVEPFIFKDHTKDPRYIDNLFQFIGWNGFAGDYHLDWIENGRKHSVRVSENKRINMKSKVIFPDYKQIYSNEFSARRAILFNKKAQPWADRLGALAFAFYQGSDNVILPTIYTPDTTPRFFEAIAKIQDKVDTKEIAESHLAYYSVMKDFVNPLPFDVNSEGEVNFKLPKIKKPFKLPKSSKKYIYTADELEKIAQRTPNIKKIRTIAKKMKKQGNSSAAGSLFERWVYHHIFKNKVNTKRSKLSIYLEDNLHIVKKDSDKVGFWRNPRSGDMYIESSGSIWDTKIYNSRTQIDVLQLDDYDKMLRAEWVNFREGGKLIKQKIKEINYIFSDLKAAIKNKSLIEGHSLEAQIWYIDDNSILQHLD